MRFLARTGRKFPDPPLAPSPDATGQGTDLCWTLLVDDPEPDGRTIGHMRKRVDELINANLRYSFGQQEHSTSYPTNADLAAVIEFG
jgi:hypothetical protein